MKPLYLDVAAATPVDPHVLAAMQPYFSEFFYNPSSVYEGARHVRQAVFEAQKRVAYWLGAKSQEVVFTAGGTEANNLAIHGIMARYPTKKILVSAIEHEAVLGPAGEHKVIEVPVEPSGVIGIDKLKEAISDDVVMISIGYVNNELGTIQPLSKIKALVQSTIAERKIHKIDTPLYVHTDACQAQAYTDLHVERLGVDMLTMNGGKIYGPKQSGALYVRRSITLHPLLQGGHQQQNRRSGTENVAFSVGFTEALDIVQSQRQQRASAVAKQRDRLENTLLAVSGAKRNGSAEQRVPHISNLRFEGIDGERFVMELDEQGIQLATGAACSAQADKPSHVLHAIGLTDKEANSSIRMSLNYDVCDDDINRAATIITAAILKQRT